jgi:shikimate kinase
MAKIIELCGSPGVGKSTIYQKVVARWKKGNTWVPGHRLYPAVSFKDKELKSLITAIAKKLYGSPDNMKMRAAARRFVVQQPALVNRYWSHIQMLEAQSFNGTDQRFEKAIYLYSLFQQMQVCLESKSEKWAFIDEGLINSIGNALCQIDDVDVSHEIMEVLSCMPLPDAIVYVHLDHENNYERLVRRTKHLPSLASLNEAQMKEAILQLTRPRQKAVQLLSEKGIPVLSIDASNSVGDNVSKIISFLEGPIECSLPGLLALS